MDMSSSYYYWGTIVSASGVGMVAIWLTATDPELRWRWALLVVACAVIVGGTVSDLLSVLVVGMALGAFAIRAISNAPDSGDDD